MNYEDLYANRIGGNTFGKDTAIYKFEKIKRAKAKAIKNNPDMEIIDFGVGEPDKIAPKIIRDTLKTAVDKTENRGYSDNGISTFKKAALEYMDNFFNVKLDYDTEINHNIGIKSSLSMIPLAFVNEGDIVFQTIPGYPVMATHSRYLGAKVINIPLLEENKFLPDLSAINPDDAVKAKLFYINYPNNPTGAVATDEFFDEIIEFAIKYNILIVQDAPYATLVFNENYKSILQRPNAKKCVLELHSMSKSFNMTGWRIGFFCGAPWAVKALAYIKDNSDSGQFKAIQEAASIGISNMNLAKEISFHYKNRLDKMVKILKSVGFNAHMPKGTFYLYVKAPVGANGNRFNNAEEAALYLIENYGISTVPWDDNGSFLRFGAVFESMNDKDDDRVLNILFERLSKANLTF
tara:strand:+ start:349 stop:1569 length:1221 start_codon:yes stop_codon:yes gene_type:complete